LAILSGWLLSYQKSEIAPFVCAGLKKVLLAKNFVNLPFKISIKLKISNKYYVEENQFWRLFTTKCPLRKSPYKTMVEPTPHKMAKMDIIQHPLMLPAAAQPHPTPT
jgi:hypothetical protein